MLNSDLAVVDSVFVANQALGIGGEHDRHLDVQRAQRRDRQRRQRRGHRHRRRQRRRRPLLRRHVQRQQRQRVRHGVAHAGRRLAQDDVRPLHVRPQPDRARRRALLPQLDAGGHRLDLLQQQRHAVAARSRPTGRRSTSPTSPSPATPRRTGWAARCRSSATAARSSTAPSPATRADGGSGFFGGAIAGGTTLTIRNTIFDGNTSQDCGAPMACQTGSSTGDGNVQWPATHVVCTGADTKCTPTTTFADAALAPLARQRRPDPDPVARRGEPGPGHWHELPRRRPARPAAPGRRAARPAPFSRDRLVGRGRGRPSGAAGRGAADAAAGRDAAPGGAAGFAAGATEGLGGAAGVGAAAGLAARRAPGRRPAWAGAGARRALPAARGRAGAVPGTVGSQVVSFSSFSPCSRARSCDRNRTGARSERPTQVG